MEQILQRGQARGAVRPDLDLRLTGDLLVGPLLYQLLVRPDESPPPDLPRPLVAVWPGIAAEGGDPGVPRGQRGA